MARGSSQMLYDNVRNLISTAKPGQKLPSEPDLARRFGVARATLREAMRTFETQGLLFRRQGSGTYVAYPTQVIDTGLEVLESIETLAERIGLKVSMGEFKVEHRPGTPEELEALRLTPDQQLLQISRVICAGGNPAAFLIDILPDNILTVEEINTGFTGSVLDLLLRKGTPTLVSSRTEINATPASPEVARVLGIQRDDGLLKFTAFLYELTGKIVDYSFSYFLPGYFKFHVIRRVG